MNRKYKFLLVLLAAITIVGLCFSTYIVKAKFPGTAKSEDEQQIKKVINQYFETRYVAHKRLQLDSFDMMIADQSANSEMQKEIDKINLEIYHATVFQLQYQSYQFFLDYGKVEIDSKSNTASVELIEGSDVVYQTFAPTVSEMRNMQHSILLKKENGNWKIKADNYEDYFWRVLKSAKSSTDDIRKGIDEAEKQWKTQLSNPTPFLSTSASLSGSLFHRISYYDRDGAMIYARDYYNNPNPYYPNFSRDCTNFVSQAMFEGGNEPMTGYYNIYGQYNHDGGWYIYKTGENSWDRSTSWAGVDQLKAFLIDNTFDWEKGPSGVEYASPSSLEPGDIIQYNWPNEIPYDPNDPNTWYVWDHSVMVMGQNNGTPMVVGRSPNVYNQPYTYFLNLHPDYYGVRFIHIRSPQIYLPTINNSSGMAIPNFVGSYPAPGQDFINSTGADLGYPAPVENIINKQNQAYPGP